MVPQFPQIDSVRLPHKLKDQLAVTCTFNCNLIWLRPDMTEKFLSGALSHNQIKNHMVYNNIIVKGADQVCNILLYCQSSPLVLLHLISTF